LLSFISCFPRVEELAISWSISDTEAEPSARFALKATPTPFGGLPHLRRLHILSHVDYELIERSPIRRASTELLGLMHHVRLLHVRELGIFFSDYIDSDLGQDDFQCVNTVIRAMIFPQLESFQFAFILVVLNLPAFDVWVSTIPRSSSSFSFLTIYGRPQTAIEQLTESALEATPATDISLKMRLDLGGNDETGVALMLPLFEGTGDDMTMHPAYLPSHDTVVTSVRRMKARHPRMKRFRLAIGYSVDEYVSPDNVFYFEYLEPTADEDSYQPQNNREYTDLRNQQDDTDSSHFRYTVYPEVIRACYDELMKEAAVIQARVGHAPAEDRIEAIMGEMMAMR
jgi:hypothetical protein